MLSKVKAEDSRVEEDAYEEMLSDFISYMNESDESKKKDYLYFLISARARELIASALNGYEMSLEDAIKIISLKRPREKKKEIKKVLTAAFDNLIEFAAAEEYQCIKEVDAMDVGEDENACLPVFNRYNRQYAETENEDAEHAMRMALCWLAYEQWTVLTYTTMQDERVRPWHRTYEGVQYPKRDFPEWLIPPIEHRCRCFLVEESAEGSVFGKVENTPKIPEGFNMTFCESVSKGGKIFSHHHPYFNIDEQDKPWIEDMINQVKQNILNG